MDSNRKKLRQKITNEISIFMDKVFNIKSEDLNTMITDMYIEKDREGIESLIEPEYLQKLDEMINPLILKFGLKNFGSKTSGLSGLDDNVIDSHSEQDNENPLTGRFFESVPDGLIPELKEKQKLANIKSFIYKLHHENLSDKEDKVEDKIEEIKEALKNNSVVLVQGDTGCGKTTKIPRMLMDEYKNIVVTQPRRIAAISVARKVSTDLKCKLGTTVGYAVRFDDQTSKNTKLKFVTDGILLKELSSQGLNNRIKYDLIIIDEAHERTINIDFLMGYLKNRPDVKLLIMSATIDSDKLTNFFNCPSICIKHKIYPIDYFYLKKPVSNYLKKTIETVIKIVKEYETGDILVFLTGQDDIERGYCVLTEYFSEINADVTILRLYSAISAEEQDLIFKNYKRKVILSTNIAETSITIENIKFIVDSGKVKQRRRSLESSVEFLEIVNISKAQSKQRAGRTGRTGPGIVYRIYTYEEYLEMGENTEPEILRSNLSNTILTLKSLNINDVVNFDYIDQPSIESIKSGLKFLYYLKAINGAGDITTLGRRLAEIPLEPGMAMVLIAAKSLGCIHEVAIIAAFLCSQNCFVELPADNTKVLEVKNRWRNRKGDFYMYLSIYNAWVDSNFSRSFISKNYLNYKVMVQIPKIKDQLLEIMNCNSKVYKKSKASPINIEEAFCAGYFMNVAKKTETGYETIFGGIECNIHPQDGLFKENPTYVLFYELVCIRRELMRNCIEIDPSILSLACSKTYKE